jgi:hypothetical protein
MQTMPKHTLANENEVGCVCPSLLHKNMGTFTWCEGHACIHTHTHMYNIPMTSH